MKRFVTGFAILGVLLALDARADDEGKGKAGKGKTLPDHYGKFKLGANIKAVERVGTPILRSEPAPDMVYMVMDVGAKDVDVVGLAFWQDKLVAITMVFQEGYSVDGVKGSLVKKHGPATNEDPAETLWVDSEHVMLLKAERNYMDRHNRLAITYGDLNRCQEIKRLQMEGRTNRLGPGADRKGGKDVSPE